LISSNFTISGKIPSLEEVKIISIALAIDVWKAELAYAPDTGSSVRDAQISALAAKFEKHILGA
jgi:hypothetical protein